MSEPESSPAPGQLARAWQLLMREGNLACSQGRHQLALELYDLAKRVNEVEMLYGLAAGKEPS